MKQNSEDNKKWLSLLKKGLSFFYKKETEEQINKVLQNGNDIYKDIQNIPDVQLKCISSIFGEPLPIDYSIIHFLQHQFNINSGTHYNSNKQTCFNRHFKDNIGDEQFKPFIGSLQGKHLDLCCGYPNNALTYHNTIKEIGGDNNLQTVGVNLYERLCSQQQEEYKKVGLNYITQDALLVASLIPSDSVDIISLNGIDKYIISDLNYCDKLLSEVIRILKKGGIIIDISSDIATFAQQGDEDTKIKKYLTMVNGSNSCYESATPSTRIDRLNDHWFIGMKIRKKIS